MLLADRPDHRLDDLQAADIVIGEGATGFRAHEGQHDSLAATQGEEEADLLRQSRLVVIGTIIFTLIETIRRQLAHTIKAGFDAAAARLKEGIEQIGAILIKRDEDPALFRREGVEEAMWPLVTLIAEHHHMVEIDDVGEGI